ncbi:hypothetical protein D3C78_559590 [compost metagenome]
MKLQTIGTLATAFAGLALAASVQAANDSAAALKAGHEYLVAVNYPGNLNIVDMGTDTLYKQCKLPGAFGPGSFQISPDRKIAYVLTDHFGALYGIELDSCKTTFHAKLALQPSERARAIYSVAVSQDGKEVYSAVNPTLLLNDRYKVEESRLQVYATDGGMDAKPVRTFPVPRQLSGMIAADDGSLYMVGPDIYRMDVKSGKYDVAIPSRNWQRPLYSPPALVTAGGVYQNYLHKLEVHYNTAKFKDEKRNLAEAKFLYGSFTVDLATGKTSTEDFGPLTEVYSSTMRSPKNPDLMYGVFNRLAKFDAKEKKLLNAVDTDHTYYTMGLNKAGSKVYIAGGYKDIAIYDADSLKRIGQVHLPGGDMGLSGLQVFVR